MIALGLLVAVAVFAYRLGDSANGIDQGDAAGLGVCSLFGFFFAGILLFPVLVGGLLLGDSQQRRGKHRIVSRVIGGLLLAAPLALMVLG